jgi:hypothetical protein
MLKEMELAEALMPRDVRTRWNSTYLMLDFAVRHGEVLDRLSGARENNLRELELSEREWRLAVQLRDVLKVSVTKAAKARLTLTRLDPQIFRDATDFFSRGTPSLAMVIPAMDHIDQVLASQSVNRTFDAPIRVALALGKKTLNRYYTLTDSSEVYRIAMSMSRFSPFFLVLTFSLVVHPRHKLAYFAKAGWEDDWIDTAHNIIRAEFDRSYAKPQEQNDERDNGIKDTGTRNVRGSLSLAGSLCSSPLTGIFQHL